MENGELPEKDKRNRPVEEIKTENTMKYNLLFYACGLSQLLQPFALKEPEFSLTSVHYMRFVASARF